MKAGSRQRWCIALALAATLAAGCRRSEESTSSAVEETIAATPVPDAAAPPAPTPLGGRHILTASPPATAADLDRLLNVGFTPDEVLAEVARRGVLRRPDAGERAHILTLPRGERLCDAMESPDNLLSSRALTQYAQHQTGAVTPDPWQAERNVAAYNSRMQTNSYRDQQAAEFERRVQALAQRIVLLRRRRTEMQQRGEMTATITMEIDRLEREFAAMVPPS